MFHEKCRAFCQNDLSSCFVLFFGKHFFSQWMDWTFQQDHIICNKQSTCDSHLDKTLLSIKLLFLVINHVHFWEQYLLQWWIVIHFHFLNQIRLWDLLESPLEMLRSCYTMLVFEKLLKNSLFWFVGWAVENVSFRLTRFQHAWLEL